MGRVGPRRGAEAGFPILQHKHAARLLDGNGVARDEMQVVQWLSPAAAQGLGYAYLSLARL
jgi:TPR repeat protein